VYGIVKPFEATMKRGLRKKEENRRDEPIQFIIHIYSEMLQGNSLHSYPK
jgi:hypothetical protein